MRNLIYIPCLICFLATPVTAEPMNVIFFVGDGMGFEAVNAARMFDNNDCKRRLNTVALGRAKNVALEVEN